MFQIAHFSDLHYSPKNLDEADRCFYAAVSAALEVKHLTAAVISGDLFDHQVPLHHDCVYALKHQVHRLARHCPVLILQGTFSHDTPGCLRVFEKIPRVCVSTRIETVALHTGGGAATWRAVNHHADILFHCLPPVDKGVVAAKVGHEDVNLAAGEMVSNLMHAWGNEYSERPITRVVVSHGTVNGCVTEHGVPMAGLDHEFTPAALAASKAEAVMLGHIHKHQSWGEGNTTIAYPGSIGRFHFGEEGDKGWLLWNLGDRRNGSLLPDDAPIFEFKTTPAKELLHLEFEGVPDAEWCKSQILEAYRNHGENVHVRIRWSIEEERRHEVNREPLEALSDYCAELKLEGRILPVQRQRAAGITEATSVKEMLGQWLITTNVEGEKHAPVLKRLEELQAG